MQKFSRKYQQAEVRNTLKGLYTMTKWDLSSGYRNDSVYLKLYPCAKCSCSLFHTFGPVWQLLWDIKLMSGTCECSLIPLSISCSCLHTHWHFLKVNFSIDFPIEKKHFRVYLCPLHILVNFGIFIFFHAFICLIWFLEQFCSLFHLLFYFCWAHSSSFL